MPIKSYLAHPQEGKKGELFQALSKLEQCEVLPAKNENVLVVVTDTENEIQENLLKEKLDAINSLRLLSLVSGFDSPQKK